MHTLLMSSLGVYRRLCQKQLFVKAAAERALKLKLNQEDREIKRECIISKEICTHFELFAIALCVIRMACCKEKPFEL